MRAFRVYQEMFLGIVEVPDAISEEQDVIDYMNDNDCWPEDFLEPISTRVAEITTSEVHS